MNETIKSEEPLGIVLKQWHFPDITREELVEKADSIIEWIENYGGDDVGVHENRLKDYDRRLRRLHDEVVPQIWTGNAGLAISAYLFTLQGLRDALAPLRIDDRREEVAAKIKGALRRVRAIEAQLKELDQRTVPISSMVERIEQAYNAADQLPTDLESLSEARKKIADLIKDATRDQSDLQRIRQEAGELDKQLNKSADDAEAVLERCETAYSAATSVGLAAAFAERSSQLTKSMWFWTGSLVVALVAGSYLGSKQLSALSELFKIKEASTAVIVLNLLLSVLSVAAPVWFAWLSTKQIGQRFRLAEDYAFKASISRAYEGFRREAARFDLEMEAKLLTSALTRLDELPLRLVEVNSHGSPWHELASSDVVKQAMKVVPGFTAQVRDLASNAIAAVKLAKTQPKNLSESLPEQKGE